MTLDQLRYPIGKFQFQEEVDMDQIQNWIADIEALPALLRTASADMTEAQLDIPYRPEGWTSRQVIHHIADSHMNAYIRFKLALTEDAPNIKPYMEDRWAELPDTQHTPIAISLQLIEALHQRWAILLNTMHESDFKKIFLHPEHGTEFPLDKTVALYAWHGKHHLGHLEIVKNR